MSDRKAINLQINLLDVMYGVVLAYGFNFFDRSLHPYNKILFFLFYTIVLVDWIFVHDLYSQFEYKNKILFFVDAAILFLVSRVIASSVLLPNFYLRWLSALFFAYFAWDLFVSRYFKKENWKFMA